MRRKMNLTEATVRALQKEDKATDNELLLNMKSYRNTLTFLDNIMDLLNGEDRYNISGLSDTYLEAEEEFF